MEILKLMELNIAKNTDHIMLINVKLRQRAYKRMGKEEEESETTKYTDGFDEIRTLNKKYGIS